VKIPSAIRCLVLCLFVVAHSASLGEAAAQGFDPIGRRLVLYPEDLEAAGVMRLADILHLAEDWRRSSIDGFTSYGAAGAREDFGDQSWTVLVDGEVVDLEVLGNLALNRLPLSPDAIASVEILNAPVLAGGSLRDRGVLRIQLRRDVRGPRGDLRTAWGQETGEPGPHRYLGESAPNVEHLGPDWFLDGGWSGERGGLAAGAVDLHHGWTDPNLYDRLVVFGTRDLIERALLGANLRARGDLLGGEQRLALSASRLEEFFYYAPFGREYPSRTDLVQLGVSGDFALPRRLTLRYGLRGSRNSLGEFDNAYDFSFAYRLERSQAHLELERRGERATLLIGIGHRSIAGDWDLAGGGSLRRDLLELGAAYEWHPAATICQQTLFQLVLMDGQRSPRLALNAEWRPSPSQRLSLATSFTSRYRIELPSPWPWIEAGYPLHPDTRALDDKDRDRRGAVELSYERLLPRNIGLELDAFWRRIEQRQWARQDYMPQAGTEPYSDQAELRGDVSGDEVGGAVALRGRLGERTRLRLSYAVAAPAAGDDFYEQIRRTVPRHRLRAVAGYNPRPSFAMSAVLDARSMSRWDTWSENPDPAVSQPVSAELSAFATLDLILRKDLWRNRLRLRFIFRNLLDADTQTFPIGGREDFSFFVSLQLRLPGRSADAPRSIP
jgi:hypothetical protein